jgi:hypothetical protein
MTACTMHGRRRRQVFVLDGENKRLTRALVREVGEEVPLAKVLEEGSDWKGRRETIIALRDTIRKMKEDRVGAHGGGCALACMGGVCVFGGCFDCVHACVCL